jgi:hypothetical protein
MRFALITDDIPGFTRHFQYLIPHSISNGTEIAPNNTAPPLATRCGLRRAEAAFLGSRYITAAYNDVLVY